MDIYVGNLAYSTTDASLHDLFAQYGNVTSAHVCTDRMTGRSKGFGFVDMPNHDEAQAAIAAINGQPFEGRPLRVNESQNKGRSSFGSYRGNDRAPYHSGNRNNDRRRTRDDRW